MKQDQIRPEEIPDKYSKSDRRHDPAVPHSVAIRIRGIYGGLKQAERKAAAYLLDQPKRVPGLTIAEFASGAGCSEATVVRLLRRLDYDTFQQLRDDFARPDQPPDSLGYEGISRKDGPLNLVEKVFHTAITSLHDTLNVLNTEEFSAVLSRLLHAERIMFCGAGDAATVAEEAHKRFIRIGVHTLFSQEHDIQMMLATQLGPRGVLLAVSHSGRTKSVIDLVKEAQKAGATIIAITNYPTSSLARRADHVLTTAAFVNYRDTEVVASRVVQLCFVESLYIAYMLQREQDVAPIMKRSNDAVIRTNKIS